jgi:hypothetical protein
MTMVDAQRSGVNVAVVVIYGAFAGVGEPLGDNTAF